MGTLAGHTKLVNVHVMLPHGDGGGGGGGGGGEGAEGATRAAAAEGDQWSRRSSWCAPIWLTTPSVAHAG